MSIENVYFTNRQRELLRLMYDQPNLSHDNWAQHLGMQTSTLRTHLRLMYRAVGINSELALVVTLVKMGWFDMQAETEAVKNEQTNTI